MEPVFLAFAVFLFFLVGLFMRYSSSFFDAGEGAEWTAWLAMLGISVAFGYLVISSPESAVLVLAVLAGKLIGGTADKVAWTASLLIILAFPLYYGMPYGIPALAAIVLALAVALDEMSSEKTRIPQSLSRRQVAGAAGNGNPAPSGMLSNPLVSFACRHHLITPAAALILTLAQIVSYPVFIFALASSLGYAMLGLNGKNERITLPKSTVRTNSN